jgi:hypothetical protein
MANLCAYLHVYGDEGVPEAQIRTLLAVRARDPMERTPVAEEDPADADTRQGAPVAVGEVLAESRKLGVVTRTDGDGRSARLCVSSALRPYTATRLLDAVETRLTRLEEARAAEQERVPAALAWLLEQDPARPLLMGTNEDVRSRQAEQFGDVRADLDLTNAARIDNARYWATYLGLGWTLASAETTSRRLFVPDPTVALLRHLPAVLRPGERATVGEAMQRLAERCPVLDGGAARAETSAAMLPTAQRPPGVISRSTSIAFTRLERRGLLRFEDLSDAAENFLLDTWPDRRRVSHVTLLRAEAA